MKTARVGAAVAIPFVVFLVALAPRLSSPSPFITWDEPTWTYRSLKFTRALESGDFAAAWQSPHPGVVTLWAGSAGIAARRLGIANGAESDSPDPSDLAWVDNLPAFDEDDVELLRRILPWHPAARAAIGWLTAALIALATWILLPLVGSRTTAIAGLLIALDPYLLAHSRVLHLDAVLALLITCSALAILRAYHASAGHRSGLGARVGTPAGDRATAPVLAGPDPATAKRALRLEFVPNSRWIAASAALGGLAALEKSPGAFAAGFAFLVIVVGAFGRYEVMRSTLGVGGDASGGDARGSKATGVGANDLDSGSARIAGEAHREGVNWPAFARSILRPLSIWGVVAGITYFAAWPALWAEPIGTIQRMAAYAAEAAGESREAVYFLGEVRPDPGALFYAVAIPHRLTPLALFGLIAGVVVVTTAAVATTAARRARSTAAWMIVLIVVFTVLMGRSAKKFERYDLPVFPAIQVVVAVGLVGAAGWVEHSLRPKSVERRVRRRQSDSKSGSEVGDIGVDEGRIADGGRIGGASQIADASPIASPDRTTLAALAALAALVFGQAAFTLQHRPYDLSYYNPLLGGGPAAAQRLPVGWGEGSDLVVRWLNAQAGAAESSLATPSMALIGPGFVGRTLRAREWPEADWVVLFIDDVQIREPRDIVDEFHGPRTPEHVVQLNGIDYAWIYAARDAQ